jgi:hypothetical protein
MIYITTLINKRDFVCVCHATQSFYTVTNPLNPFPHPKQLTRPISLTPAGNRLVDPSGRVIDFLREPVLTRIPHTSLLRGNTIGGTGNTNQIVRDIT